MNGKSLIRLFLPFLCVAVLLLLVMPRSSRFGYDFERGKPWQYETLFAKFDFPILKTDEQLAAERAASGKRTASYFRFSSETTTANINKASSLSIGSLKTILVNTLSSIYERGVLAEDYAESLPNDYIVIQKNKRAVKHPVSEVYLLNSARNKLLYDVQSASGNPSVDSIFRSNGVYDLLVPNLIYDKQATELLNTSSGSGISSTDGYVNAGQLIISNGEIVTAELEQIINSYKAEYEAAVGYHSSRFLHFLGKFIMALAIMALFFLLVYLTKPKIVSDVRIYYLLLVFLLFSAATLLIASFREDLLYCVPFTLAALYLQAFFRPKLLLPVYVVTLLPLLIFTNNGPILFTLYMIAGPVSIFAFNYLGKGWKQFIVALINFAVLALVYLAFHWMDMVHANVLRILAYLFVASLLQVLGYPLIYLFEKIFNLVSNSRLVELCDTSNSLLRQLEQKAPGTFQHSLQVMSMADAVARAIDANPLLLRAGALYHDIGKMNNPQCFVENESLVNKAEENKYHHGLTPMQSAHDIVRHVTDGYELAHQHHLPEKLCEFILTHHGTSVATYFYNKFLNEGGSPDEKPAFQYDGKKPFTKEQVILMLCDSIEAASRTLKEFTPEAYDEFVERIVSGKIAEGQLDDADISIHQLGIVKEELKQFLAHAHHERIVYPKRNKTINHKK